MRQTEAARAQREAKAAVDRRHPQGSDTVQEADKDHGTLMRYLSAGYYTARRQTKGSSR